MAQNRASKHEDLARKYANELHANEILLLAYYIAAVNIETAYQDAMQSAGEDVGYQEFPGLVLTDTFQSWEDDDRLDFEVFRENNARLEHLKKLPIRVIVGNPPYSSGQDSANDDNRNESYPSLDEAIRQTYAARSTATNKNSLYDSYIRAIKWASQRVTDRGVIAYVTNGGWLDSNTADGMRLSLTDEFSAIYVYNLRGNQRTAGEQSRKEGGKIFGGGSRATVAISLLVKDTRKTGPATIHYADIGDYLSREDKLAKVAGARGANSVGFATIIPNEHGDWLNQRRDDFETFMPLIGAENLAGIATASSNGVNTARSAWVYASDAITLAGQVVTMIDTYESDRCAQNRPGWHGPTTDSRKISWSDGLTALLSRGRKIVFDDSLIRGSLFRAFQRQKLYFSSDLRVLFIWVTSRVGRVRVWLSGGSRLGVPRGVLGNRLIGFSSS